MITKEEFQTLLILILRTYFLATSATVLIVHFIPVLHEAFIPYGKTRSASQPSQSILQRLSDITVPKAWFWRYYHLSVALSIFCGIQFTVCTERSLLPWVRNINGRTFFVWGMMLVQGSRRLYESLFIQKFSSARMWIGHYLVGCAFYTMMSLAVLAEGSNRPQGTLPFTSSD